MRALAFISLLIAAPAFAAVPPSVMYVNAAPNVNKKLAASIIGSAYKAAKQTFGASLVVNFKALGKAPGKAFIACGSDLGCLAKLADKVKADRILYGRVSLQANGSALLQMLVIGAISETVEQRFSVTIVRPSEAQNAIGIQLAALDSAQGLSTAPDAEAALAPPPPAPVAQAAPADTGAAMDFGSDAPTTPPPAKETAVAPAFADVTAAAPPRKILLNTKVPSTAQEVKPERQHKLLLPIGLATAGVGVVAIGVGAYFGVHQDQLNKSIHYGASGTTQTQAESINKQANQSAVIADGLFIAGGIVTAIGLGLLGASFF